MKKLNHRLRVLVAISFFLGLPGFAGGPSEEEIKTYKEQAERQYLDNIRATLPGFRGKATLENQLVVESVKGIVDDLATSLRTSDLLSFRTTCSDIKEVLKPHVERRKAQHEIKKLIGDLITLPPGSFVMGPAEGEPNPLNNERQRFEEIEKAYQMPVDDVTQEQYDRVMGAGAAAQAMNIDGSNFAGPKKAMGGITYAQWNIYYERLNERLADLWPKAYPGKSVPIAGRPEEKEVSYASTDPLPEGETEEVIVNGVHHEITAKHRKYPGTDRDDEADRFVVYGKDWNAGPSDVDSVEPNARGFRNLTGNIWKQTNTVYENTNGSCRVMLGGDWRGALQDCRSASRRGVHPEHPYLFVGCRLVLRYP